MVGIMMGLRHGIRLKQVGVARVFHAQRLVMPWCREKRSHCVFTEKVVIKSLARYGSFAADRSKPVVADRFLLKVDGEAWEQGRGTLRFSFNRSNKIVRG